MVHEQVLVAGIKWSLAASIVEFQKGLFAFHEHLFNCTRAFVNVCFISCVVDHAGETGSATSRRQESAEVNS